MTAFAEERLAFYAWYGECMATWTNLENVMFLAASNLFPEGMSQNILRMGFTGIQGFQSKRLFVERAVTRAIAARKDAAELRSAWDDLMAEADKLSHKRNHLAHYLTTPFPDAEEGRRMALCPWYGPKGAPKDKPPSDAYCVKELIRTRREISRLVIDLLNFVQQLHGIPTRLERPGPPQDDLPTIQQIVDRMHEELGHSRQSAKQRKREQDALNAAASLQNTSIKPDKTHGT